MKKIFLSLFLLGSMFCLHTRASDFDDAKKHVDSFVEKPDLETAEKYVASYCI